MRTTRMALLGQSGSGKSLALRHLILDHERSLFWDPVREWRGRSTSDLATLERIFLHRPFFRVAYWPDDPDDEAEAFFDFALRQENFFLAVDEADTVAPNQGKLPRPIKKFALRSRHAGISWAVATQRPAELHRTFLSQASRIRAFRLVDPRDLEAVQKYFGKAADQLPGLAIGESLEIRYE